MRADAHRNLLRVCQALALDARPDGTSMPTWDGLVERTGLGRRTVARWLAWLAGRGLLQVRETGSTPATRPAWPALEGNRAALYALTRITGQPRPYEAVQESGTPPCAHVVSTQFAREVANGLPAPSADRAACGGGLAEPKRIWPRHRVARTKADRLRAAMQLRAEVPAIRAMSTRAVRWAVGPQLRDGWTLADVIWALDHQPTGAAHWHQAAVRNPVGWLRHRLSLWAGHEPGSRLLAQQARARDARAAALRAEQEKAAAAAVPASASPEYLQARRALALLPRRSYAWPA